MHVCRVHAIDNIPLGAVKAQRTERLVQGLDRLRDEVDDRLAALVHLCSVLVHQQVGVAELRAGADGDVVCSMCAPV